MAETAAVRKLAQDKLRKLKTNQKVVIHQDDDSTSSSVSHAMQSRIDVEDAIAGASKNIASRDMSASIGGGSQMLPEESKVHVLSVDETMLAQESSSHSVTQNIAAVSGLLELQQPNNQKYIPQVPLSETENLGQIPDSVFTPFHKKGINDKRSVFQSPMDFFLFSHLSNKLPSNEQIEAETFEYKIRSARHWQSHSFKLLPGKYYILADVETENIEKTSIGLNFDRTGEMAERPWLHTGEIIEIDQSRVRNGTMKIYIQFTSTGNFDAQPVTQDVCPGSFSTAAEVVFLKAQTRQLKQKADEIESALYLTRKELDEISSTKDARKRAALKERFDTLSKEIPELEAELEITEKNLKDKRSELFRMKWIWSDVKEDVWPLMAETQPEVASRVLVDMAQSLRAEATGIRAVIKSTQPELQKRSSVSRKSRLGSITTSNTRRSTTNS